MYALGMAMLYLNGCKSRSVTLADSCGRCMVSRRLAASAGIFFRNDSLSFFCHLVLNGFRTLVFNKHSVEWRWLYI